MVGAKNIFALAILLRLLLLPFIYHPDLKSQYFQAQFLSQGHLNIFSFLQKNAKLLPYQDSFNYTPPIYIFQGTYLVLISHLLPSDFSHWLNDWGANQYSYANLPWFLLILKLPYLFFDLLLAYLIYKRLNKQSLVLWLFNPFTIYALYFHSNFDILPTFFAFFSLSLLSKTKKIFYSTFFLATAIAFKVFPLFLIPIFFIYLQKNRKHFFTQLAVFLLFYLILFQGFFPGWLNSLGSSGLLQKAFETKLLFIPVFPVIYILSSILLVLKKISHSLFLVILSCSFWILVPIHGQWLIWFLPFLISDQFISKSKQVLWALAFIMALSILKIILLNDLFMTFGHFVAINSKFLTQVTPYQYISPRFSLIKLNNFVIVLQFFLLFFALLHAKKNSN